MWSDGSGWVPESDPLETANYQDACRKHDACYRKCGSNKFDCDWNLGHDMQDQCFAQGDPCNISATLQRKVSAGHFTREYSGVQARAPSAVLRRAFSTRKLQLRGLYPLTLFLTRSV